MVRPNPLRLLLAFTMVVVGAAAVGWAPPVEAEDLIFADGFESGDLSSWSLSVPWSIRWASVHRCHYSGDATPPAGATYLNRHYRDWCDQTVWTAVTWEITENSINYQVSYVALIAAFVLPAGEIFSDGFGSGDALAWSAVSAGLW